ncbi:right-handed parallel beta-helix repeat-containing protein, partial [bacterium]|nr:right-handed parallel beta-helix repeat-containing protein [bacterium]
FALDDTVLEIHSSVYPVLIKNLKLTDVSVAEGKAIVTKAEREIVFSGLNLKDYEIGVEVQSQVKIENSNIESVNGVAQIAIDIKQSIFPNVFTIIKNSTIKNYQAGVQLAGSGHEVVGNTIKNCGVGINVNNGQNIKLSNNTITNGVAAKGIVATDSSGLLLNSNEFDIYENIAEYLVEFNNTNVNTRVLDYRIDPIEPDPEHDCQADAKPANKEPCRVGKVFGPLQQGQYIQFYKLDQDLYKVNYNMDCISYGDANVWNDVLGFNNEDRTGIVFECSTINDELSSTKMYFTSVQQGVDGDGGSVDVETSSFAFFDHKDAGCVEKILTPTIELQGETIVIAPGATDETADEFIGDLGGGDDPSDFDNDGDDDLADNSDLGDQMAAGGITDAEAVTGQGAGNPGSGDGGFLFMPGSSGGAGSVASDPDRPCSLIISQNNSHNYLIFLLWLLPVIILRKIRFNK